jgi:hypothetical protein
MLSNNEILQRMQYMLSIVYLLLLIKRKFDVIFPLDTDWLRALSMIIVIVTTG